MKLYPGLTAAVACLLLAACNVKDMLKPDPEAQTAAEAAYAEIVRGETDKLFAHMPKEVDTPQQRRMVTALREIIPNGPATGQITGVNKNVSTGGQTQVLTYIYDYGHEKVQFSATLQRKDDKAAWRAVGFNLSPAAASADGFAFGKALSAPPLKPVSSKAPAGSGSGPDPKSPG